MAPLTFVFGWFFGWFFGWLRSPEPGNWREERLRELAGAGRTVEVSELRASPPARVVRTNLGYGTEYWAVYAGEFRVDRATRTVREGRLVVRDGTPVERDAPLREQGLSPEEIFIRF